MAVVNREFERADPNLVKAFAEFGVATVHEAQGRRGLMQPWLRPIAAGMRAVGSAVTVSVPPGDNWMIHVAVEECIEGDLLVVAPTSESSCGYFGELLATAVSARGVAGLVIEAGCRDVSELSAIGFPVWSKHISAQGTVKETLGDVNLPLVCGGQLVEAGDIVVADDDGVVVIRREEARAVLQACAARDQKEAQVRLRYEAGESPIDVMGARGRLADAGLRIVSGGSRDDRQ